MKPLRKNRVPKSGGSSLPWASPQCLGVPVPFISISHSVSYKTTDQKNKGRSKRGRQRWSLYEKTEYPKVVEALCLELLLSVLGCQYLSFRYHTASPTKQQTRKTKVGQNEIKSTQKVVEALCLELLLQVPRCQYLSFQYHTASPTTKPNKKNKGRSKWNQEYPKVVEALCLQRSGVATNLSRKQIRTTISKTNLKVPKKIRSTISLLCDSDRSDISFWFFFGNLSPSSTVGVTHLLKIATGIFL